jgi:hypothetical protein
VKNANWEKWGKSATEDQSRGELGEGSYSEDAGQRRNKARRFVKD